VLEPSLPRRHGFRGLSECFSGRGAICCDHKLKGTLLALVFLRKPSVYPDHFFAGGDSVLDFREEEEALDLKK